jgi:hypothetical protein
MNYFNVNSKKFYHIRELQDEYFIELINLTIKTTKNHNIILRIYIHLNRKIDIERFILCVKSQTLI